MNSIRKCRINIFDNDVLHRECGLKKNGGSVHVFNLNFLNIDNCGKVIVQNKNTKKHSTLDKNILGIEDELKRVKESNYDPIQQRYVGALNATKLIDTKTKYVKPKAANTAGNERKRGLSNFVEKVHIYFSGKSTQDDGKGISFNKNVTTHSNTSLNVRLKDDMKDKVNNKGFYKPMAIENSKTKIDSESKDLNREKFDFDEYGTFRKEVDMVKQDKFETVAQDQLEHNKDKLVTNADSATLFAIDSHGKVVFTKMKTSSSKHNCIDVVSKKIKGKRKCEIDGNGKKRGLWHFIEKLLDCFTSSNNSQKYSTDKSKKCLASKQNDELMRLEEYTSERTVHSKNKCNNEKETLQSYFTLRKNMLIHKAKSENNVVVIRNCKSSIIMNLQKYDNVDLMQEKVNIPLKLVHFNRTTNLEVDQVMNDFLSGNTLSADIDRKQAQNKRATLSSNPNHILLSASRQNYSLTGAEVHKPSKVVFSTDALNIKDEIALFKQTVDVTLNPIVDLHQSEYETQGLAEPTAVNDKQVVHKLSSIKQVMKKSLKEIIDYAVSCKNTKSDIQTILNNSLYNVLGSTVSLIQDSIVNETNKPIKTYSKLSLKIVYSGKIPKVKEEDSPENFVDAQNSLTMNLNLRMTNANDNPQTTLSHNSGDIIDMETEHKLDDVQRLNVSLEGSSSCFSFSTVYAKNQQKDETDASESNAEFNKMYRNSKETEISIVNSTVVVDVGSRSDKTINRNVSDRNYLNNKSIIKGNQAKFKQD